MGNINYAKITPLLWLNGGPEFKFSEALSFVVSCTSPRAMQALLQMVKLDIKTLKRAYHGKVKAVKRNLN